MVDFSNFQTLSAELHLIVGSSQKIETAVVKNTNQVAGAIDPIPKVLQSGKLFGCEVIPFEISFANQSSRNA
jgi:hypothetical protein